jgi:hypothetical protein
MDEHSNEWTPWHWHLWQIEVINTSLERLFQGLQNEHLKFWIWNLWVIKVLTKLFTRFIELIAKLSMDCLLNCLYNSMKLTTKLQFFKNEFFGIPKYLLLKNIYLPTQVGYCFCVKFYCKTFRSIGQIPLFVVHTFVCNRNLI